jgi:hypothetical protein
MGHNRLENLGSIKPQAFPVERVDELVTILRDADPEWSYTRKPGPGPSLAYIEVRDENGEYLGTM